MDVRRLTAFQTAATLIGLSQMATDVDYARSGVTGRIGGLEDSLGVELFERLSGRG